MGMQVTEGLGAGSQPEVGRAAAEEVIDEIRDQLAGSHMVFITAGMGGGTGTGAAPVVARAARELGILTVGVVTKPFQFEGVRRMRLAEAGINELQQSVDTLIVIPNQNLFRVATEKTTFADAFAMADQVLYSGVACITDLMVKEGLINLDFADVRSVMRGMGKAMMGTGEASGEKRAIRAAEAAIANPLLDDVSMKGARGLLISITGGNDLTLYELDEAATRIREEVDQDANIILGATFDESLEGIIRVSVVATGIDQALIAETAASCRRPSSGSPRWPSACAPRPAPAPRQPQAIADLSRGRPSRTGEGGSDPEPGHARPRSGSRRGARRRCPAGGARSPAGDSRRCGPDPGAAEAGGGLRGSRRAQAPALRRADGAGLLHPAAGGARRCVRRGCRGSTSCRCRPRTRSAPAAARNRLRSTSACRCCSVSRRSASAAARKPQQAPRPSAPRQEAPRQQMSSVHAEYAKRRAGSAGLPPGPGSARPQGQHGSGAPGIVRRRSAGDSGLPAPPGQLTGRHVPSRLVTN